MGISLNELSHQIGLSTATISRTLNNEGNVTPETRKIVLDAVQKYGYTPKTKRQTSRQKNSDLVIVITGDLQNPVHLNLVSGIEAELSKHGKHSVVVQTYYSEDLQAKYLQYASESKFSCIILLNAIENKNLIRFIKSPANPPVIFVNREPSSVETNSITMDNRSSGYIAAKKLVENGHSRIMVISGPEDSTVCRDRIKGFQAGLEEFGLSFNPNAIFHGNRSYAFGFSVGETIVSLPHEDRPTALYALSGTMAGGFIDAFNTHGLYVPEDISIICNDTPSTAFARRLSISSVEIDYYSMGMVAAKRYMEIISSKDHISKQIMFMPTIFERKSVKKIGGI